MKLRDLLFLIAACLPVLACDATVEVELGSPEVVLADQALGLRYFPDGRLGIVRMQPDCRALLSAGVSSFLLEGPAMGRFTKATKVLDKGKPSDFDNGYAGINAAVRAPSGNVLAFYHAEDQEGMKSVGHGIPGFYCSVGLAVSTDDGLTFHKRGSVLSGQLAKDPNGRPDQGVGEPWVFAEPSGKYLYAYYTSHERVDGRGVQICMARCPISDSANPAAWKKYFAGGFTEPGLGGKDTPVVVSGRARADALFPHVLFLRAPRLFVMIFCLNVWWEAGHAKHSGFYLALSDDGIHWPPERQRQIWSVPVIARTDCEVAWHPTWIPDGPDATTGWLYYGYSEWWGHKPPNKPHYLVRRRLGLSRP